MSFLGRQLLQTAQSCLRAYPHSLTNPTRLLPRLFSTTPAVEAYKMKSHSGAKKRWRSLSGSAFKRVRIVAASFDSLYYISSLSLTG